MEKNMYAALCLKSCIKDLQFYCHERISDCENYENQKGMEVIYDVAIYILEREIYRIEHNN